MAELDAHIRSEINNAVQQIKGGDPDSFVAMAADELRDALLFMVSEHERYHRELGAPREDHTNEGLPLCQGWPYRKGAYAICRFVRDIADKLGVEVSQS